LKITNNEGEKNKKMRNKERIKLAGYGLMLMVSVLTGCAAGTKKPERNKMPELNSFQDFDDQGFAATGAGIEYGLTTTSLTLETQDGMQSFVRIPLPDASTDSVTIKLVNTMKPFALPLLSAWSAEQKSGVMLDLSSHKGGVTHRTNYVLAVSGGPHIPIMILWDQGSAYRAAMVKSLVAGVPYVSLNLTSGDDPSSLSAR
jgi:hypothetical protein